MITLSIMVNGITYRDVVAHVAKLTCTIFVLKVDCVKSG